MFFTLLWKECRMWMKSLIFYSFAAILFVLYVSQMGSVMIEKPLEGQDSYGEAYSDDETVIMNGTLKQLLLEYFNGRYISYPIGLYKEVTLSQDETKKVEGYISRMTGMPKEEWQREYTAYMKGYSSYIDDNGTLHEESDTSWNLHVTDSLSYQSFLRMTDELSDMIGKGSRYDRDHLDRNGIMPKTYEQALAEYENILEKDQVTKAYARLFSDYLVLMLGILPAFFATARMMREKKAKISQVVYAKNVRSITIITSRYAGMVAVQIATILLISCFPLFRSVHVAHLLDASPDYLAFLKYVLGWLLPTILFVTSISCLISELTEHMLAILVCVIWWLASILIGMRESLIMAGWNLMPRFNALGEYSEFERLYPQLLKNRMAYVLGAILILTLTILVYDRKRKGGLNVHGKVYEAGMGKLSA